MEMVSIVKDLTSSFEKIPSHMLFNYFRRIGTTDKKNKIFPARASLLMTPNWEEW